MFSVSTFVLKCEHRTYYGSIMRVLKIPRTCSELVPRELYPQAEESWDADHSIQQAFILSNSIFIACT